MSGNSCLFFWFLIVAYVSNAMQQPHESLQPLTRKRSADNAQLQAALASDSNKKIVREETNFLETISTSIVVGSSGRVAKPVQQQSGVFKTINGFTRSWRVPVFDTPRVKEIMAMFKMTEPAAQMLLARGHATPESIQRFMYPGYDGQTLHASQLKNALKAVLRIEDALTSGQSILVCGDYDPDGMTSSALLIKCLERLGAKISYKIPHRIKDGYGLKAPTVDFAKNNGYSLMITVDNGIAAFDAAKRAKELGVDLIVTDHHLAHHDLPDAYTIVNPNQPECTHPSKFLAGVGVAFKLMSLLYERKNNEPLPDTVYELMMLGTIADVVPQEGENRYWIRKGLELVNRTKGSASFKKLVANAAMEQRKISSTDIAFAIAPQLNAIGRLDDANQGVQFLLERTPQDTETIGNRAKELNEKRKDIQAEMFKNLKEAITDQVQFKARNNIIMASSKDWHLGVNGLVASKATEHYHKPAFIFTEIIGEGGDVLLKGSARTIPGFNLFQALTACKDLLVAYGGHIAAAGLMMKQANAQALKDRLEEFFNEHYDKKMYVMGGTSVDAVSSFDKLVPAVVEDFSKVEPFGNANAQPHIIFENVQVASDPLWMGKFGRGHVSCHLSANGCTVPVKFFFKPQFFFLLKELKEKNLTFKLLGTPTENNWKGRRTLEINAVDIEKVFERNWQPDPNRQPTAPRHVHLYQTTEQEMPVVD